MKATQKLHDLGQSLWLDNITRGLLTGGTLSRYVGEVSVTGLTSNPSLCLTACEELKSEGTKARVISMPSWDLFEAQSREYRDSALPPEIVARVAVEEASSFGWERYTGLRGTILGLHTFGISAPMKVVAQHFGFEPEHVVAEAREQIAITREAVIHPGRGGAE